VWKNLVQSVTRETIFEYWGLGTPAPKITSADTITVNVGDSINYLVTATSEIGITGFSADLGATGLTFNSGTRRITGSFSTAGTRTITVSATNSYGTRSKTVTILVSVVTPVITSPLAASSVAGIPFTYQFSATNATSFLVNLNGVEGISYNSSTRRITGAFTSGGVKAITLTASNADATTTRTLNVTVAVVTPVFTSALTEDNIAGLPFTYTLAARDATDFSVAFGTTAGLTYDAASRTISGALTAAGTFNVSLTASNAYASQTSTLVITARVVAPLIGRYVRLTSLTRAGTVATAASSAAHGLAVGDLVNIVGATVAAYNGTFTITAVPGPTSLQYTVSGSPATPAIAATPEGILAGPGALTMATRAGDDFNFELIATNATNTAVDFGTSTGLAYSSETRRITGEFTSVAPLQTLRLTAGNLLANTSRDLTVAVTIPVPRVTSALQVRAITGRDFSYVLTTVDATSVAVTFGTALGLNYNEGTRTFSGAFADSQAGSLMIDLALANEFTTNNQQLLINVEVPRLQDPADVVLSLLSRVWADPSKQMTVYGNDPVPPAKFDLYGLVSWQNTEQRPHNVILTVAGRRTTRSAGTTEALVYLATWTAPEVAPKTISVGVQLTGTEFSSNLVATNVTLDGAAVAEFSGDLAISDEGVEALTPSDSLLVPGWSGALDRLGGSGTNLGNLVYDLADEVVAGDYYFVSPDKRALALPSRLLEGELYRAELRVATGTVQARGTTYQVTWDGMNGTRRVPPQYVTRPHYNVALSGDATAELPFGTALIKSLYFNAPGTTAPFTATTPPTRTVVINQPVRIELLASLRATWTIQSIVGSGEGFGIEYDPPIFAAAGPERAYLVGTPSAGGSVRFNMTARNGTRTATASVAIAVVASLPRTAISVNAQIARDGYAAKTGDELSLAFTSAPALARWTATGLPPGVRLNQDGTIVGRFTRLGTYLATIGAQGLPTTAWEASLPTTIKFVIAAGDGTVLEDYSAAARSPWLLTEWQLIDLHVLARSREVQSTMFEGGALRIKVGDALNFGIFFVDADDSVFALAPERLRLTIRKEDNLDDLMIFKGGEPPVAVESNFQTYYELNVITGAREREVALEWAEENEKNEPLKCVADLDWVVAGKNYSSRTFPVILELDVTRP
jgi:PKD repeat protein